MGASSDDPGIPGGRGERRGRTWRLAALVGGLAPLVVPTACSVYDFQWVYEPQTQVVHAAGVRTTVSIAGRRRAETGHEHAGALEVTLHVHNESGEAVTIDPGDVTLLAKTPPEELLRVGAASSRTILQGSMTAIVLFFETPDEPPEGLEVHLRYEMEGEVRSESTAFQRQPDAYYDRFPRRIGVGYQRMDLKPEK